MPDFTEIGVTGLEQTGGIVREEWHPRLKGAQAAKVYAEMADNNQVVGAVLHAIAMRIRRVPWTTTPYSDDPEDVRWAEWADGARNDMSHTWEDGISESLTMLQHGWSLQELVYKQRDGQQPLSPGLSSAYADGMVGWRKVPIRAQDTRARWVFDDEGGIQAMVQNTDDGPVTIPIEKALLFRTTITKGNPEGRSVLRTAYRAYYFQKRVEEYEAVGIERDLAGIPVIGIPPEYLSGTATAEQTAAADAWKAIGRNLRNDEQASVVYPLDYTAEGHPRYKVELMGAPGAKQFDTGKVIERWARYIAMSVLADVILLGHEKVGSEALARTKSELFTLTLDAWLQSIADVWNRHALPRLFALNGLRTDRLPQFTPGKVTEEALADVVEMIGTLSSAGADLFPNEVLAEWLAGRMGAPPEAFDPDMGDPDAAPPPRPPEPEPKAEDEPAEPSEPGAA